MPKTYLVLNKCIALVSLVLVAFAIGYTIWFIQLQTEFIENLNTSPIFTGIKFSFWDQMADLSAPLFIAFVLSLSGVLMLFKRRVGWVLGYISYILLLLNVIPLITRGYNDPTVTIATEANSSFKWIFLSIAVVNSLMIIGLSLNHIRKLNKISHRAWGFSLVVPSLLYLLMEYTHTF